LNEAEEVVDDLNIKNETRFFSDFTSWG